MKETTPVRTRWRGPQTKSLARALAALAAAAAMCANIQADPAPDHGIVAGNIDVIQLGFGGTEVTVTAPYVIGDFRIRPSANKGDYDVQIGDVLADDVNGGVLISSVAENGGRENVDQSGNPDPVYPGVNTATAHIDYSRTGANTGGYWIPVAMTYPNSAGTTVVEYNLNVSAAWFPYDRYIGAFIRNATGANGGANDLISGSPTLALGTHFIDLGAGRSTVNLTTMGINSQTDGVLLVVGAKNEDNYALSQANADGTWTIYSKDNGTADAALEQDPIAFVYIPKTDPNLVSGRFLGDGTVAVGSGNFTIASIGAGQWELKIPGRAPGSGVLLVSPEGGQTQNRDNIVSAEANEAGDGWIIESRDLPAAVPPGNTLPPLETPGVEPVASFVFVPGPTPGITVSPRENIFTSENQTQATFTVVLDTRPSGNVTIPLSVDDATEGVLLTTSLTFTPDDWNLPQTVAVIGEEDALNDGPVAYHVVIGAAVSEDPIYNGRDIADVTITNLDNDGGVTVIPTAGLVVTEGGGQATFTVQLDRAPTADVTIALSSSNTGEATVSPASLTFTAGDWNIPQTVTVTGVDESVDDGNTAVSIITASAVSADAFFNGKNPADVALSNTDDDTAAINIAPINNVNVVETQTTPLTVVLGSQPRAEVTIAFASSDATEAAASPASVTFTAANWNVPQTVNVQGVDDLVVDGVNTFVLTTSVTTTDATYGAITPSNINGSTADNEGALTLPGEGLIYGIGMPAMSVAGRVSLVDPNTANYAGGSLRLALTQNAATADRLAIRNVGTAEGQIGADGNSITYGGTQIGTFTGGDGANALVVALNSNATPAAVQALLQAITFVTATENASRATRTLAVTLTDGDGGVSTASTTIRVGSLRRADFQEGADHGYGVYTGAHDIELNEARPDTAQPVGRNNNGMLLDWRDADTPNAGHVLMRFDNIVGTNPGQVPPNAIVVSAELFLDVNDTGDGSPMHRMLVSWDPESATWNSVGGGIFPDGERARVEFDSQIGVVDGSGATGTGNVWVSVTPDVQAWVSGAANHGWIMPGWELRLDGTSISPSEAANIGDRPRLRVLWLPPESVSTASFRQGTDGYTGAVDTRIRQTTPDLDSITSPTVYSDAIVTGSDPNPEQVLLRFDNIIGSGPGQIPAGSRVEAAFLDVASVINNAMGDGGAFHALLRPWPETSTWNTWENGIEIGVEAAAAPTVLAGSPTLDPDVQGGFLSFDLTADVAAWVGGTLENQGWVIQPFPGGGNGWGFATAEDPIERNHPRLRVYYTAGTPQPTEIELGQPIYTATGVQLNFTGAPSMTYRVRRSATIDGQFSDIGPATTDAQGNGAFTDNAAPVTAGFYVISTQ